MEGPRPSSTATVVVRSDDCALRVGQWRSDPEAAQIVPIGGDDPPDVDLVRRSIDVAARQGRTVAYTGALGPIAARAFLALGFVEHERLALLAHDLTSLPDAPAHRLRRGRVRELDAIARCDAAAFPAFWAIDAIGVGEALAATASSRLRVADHPDDRGAIGAYAVTGRFGRYGYLQRLAVDPRVQRAGVGSALVRDALRWCRRRRVAVVLVNTHHDNEPALALYRSLGFVDRADGLVVLSRALT